MFMDRGKGKVAEELVGREILDFIATLH